MKRSTTSLTVLAVLLYLGGIPAFAQHSRGGPPSGSHGPGTSGPSTSTDTHGKSSPSEILEHNTALTKKLQDLGVANPATDCQAFKNLGQCVAAAHVAHNLGGTCTFSSLKGAMTGSPSETLGQAIHGCDPHVDAKAEAKKGKKQADNDLKETGS